MSINNTNNEIDSSKKGVNSFLTINDLKEKDSNDEEISTQQRVAIKNYDRYKVSELKKQETDKEFNKRFMQLQVMANLTPFDEFLKEEYFL